MKAMQNLLETFIEMFKRNKQKDFQKKNQQRNLNFLLLLIKIFRMRYNEKKAFWV